MVFLKVLHVPLRSKSSYKRHSLGNMPKIDFYCGKIALCSDKLVHYRDGGEGVKTHNC
jgi:hypothetical protein